MRKEIILPGLALVGGLGGFLLRRWELATAFEPDSGLVIPGMPATWALIAFSAVIVLALALLARGKHNTLPSYDVAFSAKGNTLYMFFMTAAAGLTLLSGGMILLEIPTAYAEAEAMAIRHGTNASLLSLAPQALLAVLCLCSAASLFLVGRNNYKAEGKGRLNPALLFPAYAACLWLMVSYQARSGDPVVLDYVWQLFAIIASVLGTYFMAGFAFERSRVFHASLFSLLGIFFIPITLADRHPPSSVLLYGAFLLYLFPSVVTLLFNAHRPMIRRMPEGGPRGDEDTLLLTHIDLEESNDE